MSARSSTRTSLALLTLLAAACGKSDGTKAAATGAGAGDGKGGGNGAKHELMLGAAASLRSVTPALVDAFRQREGEGGKIDATYGSSGDLKKQVAEGAPIDVVLFASGKPVDDLVKSG